MNLCEDAVDLGLLAGLLFRSTVLFAFPVALVRPACANANTDESGQKQPARSRHRAAQMRHVAHRLVRLAVAQRLHDRQQHRSEDDDGSQSYRHGEEQEDDAKMGEQHRAGKQDAVNAAVKEASETSLTRRYQDDAY